MKDKNITCINKAISDTDNALNDILWHNGSQKHVKALQRRLNALRLKRDNGELYEVRF